MAMAFTDFLALRDRLRSYRQQFRREIGLLDRTYAAYSARIDLDHVNRSLEILTSSFQVIVDEKGESRDPVASSISKALFFHAVVVYARATETSSDTRKQVSVRDKLPGRLRETHRFIRVLRNDAMAHFGPGEDRWSREALFFDKQRGGVGIYRIDSNYRESTLRDFVDLGKMAREIVGKLADELQNEVHEKHLGWLKSNKLYARLVAEVDWDEEIFIGNRHRLAAFKRGGEPGRLLSTHTLE